MDSLEQFNSTDTRVSRTIHSPLLNLLLAASILSKITHGKAYLQSPWMPFRPIFAYYPQQQWYHVDPFLYQNRLHANNQPQQPLNQQQIIHIHEAPSLTAEAEDDDPKRKYIHSVNTFPQDEENQEETDSTNQQFITEEHNITQISDEMESASSNEMADMYDSIKVMYDRNETLPPIISLIMSRLDEANVSLNEIPEPDNPYGKPFDQNQTIYENVEDQIAEENIMVTISPIDNKTVISFDENIETTTEIDQEVAESNNEELLIAAEEDLQSEEANIYRRRQKPQNQDYNYYDYDNNVAPNRRKPRPTPAAQRQRTQRPKPYKTQPVRINSKRGQYRPTTPLYDEYDYTTRYNRRKTTPKRGPVRRRTSTRPTYEADDYDDNRNYYNNNRRKPITNFNQRRPTTASYDDYYDDYERDYYNNEQGEDDYIYTRQKENFRPRQQETTTESTTTETSSESTSTSTSSSTTTTTGSSSTSTDTSSTQKATTVTAAATTTEGAGGYYYGHSGSGNVSITYGPPPPHPGYGPSNGNEHVSITYGPPTGAGGNNIAPLLDSWYNQYAKTSVIKRIQELLTPNNYYSPQYDIEKFNYNDMSIF